MKNLWNGKIFRVRNLSSPAGFALGVLALAVPLGCGGAAWAWALALAAVFSALSDGRVRTVFALGMALTAAVWSLKLLCAGDDALSRLLPPGRDLAAEARIVVDDPRICSLADINPPGLIEGRVVAFTPAGETAATAADDRVALRLPDDFCASQLSYGETLTVRGRFAMIPSEMRRENSHLTTGGFTLRDRLGARGITRIFYARELLARQPGGGWRAALIKWRDHVLDYTLTGIDDPRCRRWIAALYFGLSGAPEYAEREQLAEAGVSHLFSVSGLHVAMLAAVLWWLLRPLAFGARMLVMPVLLLGYAISTGANPPAMRAWLMISLLCVLRSRLLWMPVWEILLLCGALMLAAEPGLLAVPGFLYSFGITAALILTGKRTSSLERELSADLEYMPERPRKWRYQKLLRYRRIALFSVSACAAAFLGGAGLTLYLHSRLPWLSAAANLLLLPLTALLFPMLFLKWAVGWLPGLNVAAGWLLEAGFGWIAALAEVSSQWGRFGAIRPGAAGLAVFYAGFFGFLLWNSPCMRRAAAVAAVAMLGFWSAAPRFMPPAIQLVYGGSAEVPGVVLVDPEADIALAVNPSGYDAARCNADFLLCRGVDAVDYLLVDATRKNRISGLNSFYRRIGIRHCSFPELDRYSGAFKREVGAVLPGVPGAPLRGEGAFPFEIIAGETGFTLAYWRPGSTFNICARISTGDQGCRMELRRPDGSSEQVVLPPGNIPEVWNCEF